MKVALESTSLTFSGKAAGSLYEFSINFFKPIKKEESKWSTKRLIEFYLKKEEVETWSTLQKGPKKTWIKIDWNRWQDSDDEGEAKNFNLDNMGAMGDMNFGGDDFDSDDDEDLPDLTPSPSSDK